MKVNAAFVFDFERLEVYQKAVEFTNEVFKTTLDYQRDIQYSLGDQFRRAALSICNNIAEGSRKLGRSKVQFYNYALDSARECIPMISISHCQSQINSEKVTHLREQCVQITRMLYRLADSVQN